MADDRRSRSNAANVGEPSGLQMDDTPLSIGLKVVGAGSKSAGIRSPIAQQQGSASASVSSVGSSASSQSAPAAADQSGSRSQGRAPHSMREISQIKGLAESSHHLPLETSATHISHVMYDPAPARSRRFVWLLFIAFITVMIGILIFSPTDRRWAVKKLHKAQVTVKEIIHPSTRKKRLSKISVYQGAERMQHNGVVAPGRKNCGALLVESSGGGRLSLGERVDLAECQTVMGDMAAAEAALKPIAGRIGSASEAEINSAPSSRSIADAYQTLIAIYLKEGKAQDASKLLRGKCIRWEQSNTCVGKAMLFADRRIGNAGIDALFVTQSKLDRKAQARIWLAGAQLALAADSPSLADRRYGFALAAAPKDALALRKTIYETQAVDLFHRGDVPKLKQTVDKAMRELRPVGKEGKMKLSMVLELATAPDKARRTREMLTREELTFRARRDFDLIDILGPESLKSGLEADYMRLLKRTREFYTSKYNATDQVGRKLAVWEIRATISSGDNERALAMTQGYDRAYGVDAFSRHMRGVAYHLASAHERYQFLAAQEFQGALRLNKSWESLYALGVTLTRAGRKEMVATVIHDLDAMTNTKGQKFWADMLKAEWYIAQGKLPNAKSVLEGWIRERPDAFTPQQLLVKLLNQWGKTGEAARAEQSLNELNRDRRFHGSKESLASPLGPMALGKRPLE